MKKLLVIVLMVLFATGFAVANGDGEEGAAATGGELEDGFYFAQQTEFSGSGWKYMVSIEVEDGEIVEVEWNGANKAAGTDKITRSESGEYGMVARGGAQAEWHEQAAAVEEYLLEVQDPGAIEYDDETGNTDAISGVSIHINEFVEMAEKALSQGPVGRGPYQDGAYHAEAAEFSHGWKDAVDITVVSGYIVAAYWNPIPEEGEKGKYQASVDGEYGMMENGGAQAPWFEQVDVLAAELIETQDPTAIPVNDEGGTDAVSGVSITVSSFLELVEEALADAQ